MSGSRFWWRVLVVVIVGIMTFGLALVAFPDLAVKAFSVLVYSSPAHLDSFGRDAVSYIELVHAVLGAVLFGWGALLLFVALGPLRHGSRAAWRMSVVSLVAWYLPDTVYSLLSGYWQNAALNTGLAVPLAVALLGMRLATQSRRT